MPPDASAPVILIADDQKNTVIALRRALQLEGYQVDTAADGHAALQRLRSAPCDLALVDVRMPGLSGLDLLTTARAQGVQTPIVVMSGFETLATAAEATQRGAIDFLEKPIGTEKLLVTVRNALQLAALLEEKAARERAHAAHRQLVGRSPAMQGVCALLDRAAPTSTRVLVTGERGTGKELVARALHEGSPRAARPYVTFNCAALPESLAESELFGHEKGAFTGAVAARRGLFERAHGGTLFLDEIGELGVPLQAKLLRALQEGEVARLGADGAPLHVDVRLVAATNQDLDALIRAGRFRADLRDRLAVLHVVVPALRDRREDIPDLVSHAVARLAAERDLRPRPFGRAALDALAHHDWPGNVRELLNAVERILILSDAPEIGAADVAAALAPPSARAAAPAPGPTAASPAPPALLWDAHVPFDDQVAQAERTLLQQALAAHDGNVVRTAQALQLRDASALYKRMRVLGISPRGRRRPGTPSPDAEGDRGED
ncbi:MAG TPA: sigma-54 dependent transcriptional regulator [Myxococcota bacterium]|nr:sigma-54 dependent transcriptional regulator [Myxococcota bacterium]